MLYKGKRPTQNIEFLVLPRAEGNIELECQSIVSYEIFDKQCPMPVPPVMTSADGKTTPQYNDPKFKLLLQHYSEQKTAWLIIQSLKATKELAWETVKEDDPETWGNWQQELRDSFFSAKEIDLIVGAVMDANSLNDERIEEARSRFLASRLAEKP